MTMRKETSIKNLTTLRSSVPMGDQHCKEGAVLGESTNSARYSRGRRGRRGRIAHSREPKEAESDGSQLSLVSIASEDTRKRKAKAPSVKSVAAKYKAVAASASATPTEVEDMATELKAIEEVANRSRNLKGSFAQSLRLAVRNVKAAAEELARRATTDENIARLERENAELRSTLSSLSNRADKLTEEINYLRKQTHERVSLTKPNADAPTPSSSEEAIMERIGAFVESKLAAFEARLLPTVTPSQKKRHKKKKKRQKPTYPPVADLPPVAKPVPQTSISAVTNSWADVAKKQKVHQSIQKSPQYYVPNERPTKIRRKPVRAPTSAAVTITLREGSTATYGSIMKDAKTKIRLE
ncbi:unnamed protein product, partial [Iphiclides podalirius]